MNTFIAIYKKDKNLTIDEALFTDYLIAEPERTQVWYSKDRRVVFISYVINERTKVDTIISDEDSVLTYEGFPLLTTEKYEKTSYMQQLFSVAKQRNASLFDILYGEFSTAFYTNNKLHIGANLGGTHGLYYTKNEHLVAFTNRSPLLLQLPGVSTKIDIQASAWKSYQGYISTHRTPFSDIKKLPIGSVFSVDKHLNITEKKTTYDDLKKPLFKSNFKDNPIDAYQEQFDSITNYMHKFKQHYNDLKLNVPLSGGKDSRLILAFLLKAGLKDDIDKIWTRGTLYSPEVISSQHICKELNLPEPEINRLKTALQTNISAPLIINNLNNLEGNLSLYDFSGIGNYKYITMQGHQLALRDGAFTNCRTNTLDNFLEDAILARMHDPYEILNKEFSNKTHQEYKNIFSDYHINEGAPLHDLGDLYNLRDRLLNWASIMCNSQYYSGPLSNPLLLGDIIKYSFSIPYEFRTHEVFHYLGIKHCAPKITNIPFAEQKWNDNLGNVLKKLGIDDPLIPSLPYKSHKDFPNISHPFMSTIKIDYFNELKDTAVDLCNKHKKDLQEYMLVDKFTKKLKNTPNPQFRDLFCGLGVYSDLILREYKEDIFNRKNKLDVAKDLASRISRPTSIAVSKTNTSEEKIVKNYEILIERHEKSIASLVKEIQLLQEKAAQDKKIESITDSSLLPPEKNNRVPIKNRIKKKFSFFKKN